LEEEEEEEEEEEGYSKLTQWEEEDFIHNQQVTGRTRG